jgi:hypothetical protein
MVVVESLLGKLADWARRCRMLSTELRARVAGVPFVGDTGRNVAEAEVGSVGVGGVTRVVGVSRRLGGVAGTVVSSGLTLCCGVSGLCWLATDGAESCGCTNCGGSSALGWSLTLFLLLEALNKPPKPPLPPPADFTESVSPDFFRDSLPRNLLAGDGLRSGGGGAGRVAVVTDGSMMLAAISATRLLVVRRLRSLSLLPHK